MTWSALSRVFRDIRKTTLPGYLGFFPFLHNFRQRNACEQAEMSLYAALDPAVASRARTGDFVRCLDPFDLLQTREIACRTFAADSTGNASHINDPKLTVMLKEQRRIKDLEARKKIIHDIQRYAAEHVYFVYLNVIIATAAWQPYVKNLGPNITFDSGSRTAALWLDR